MMMRGNFDFQSSAAGYAHFTAKPNGMHFMDADSIRSTHHRMGYDAYTLP